MLHLTPDTGHLTRVRCQANILSKFQVPSLNSNDDFEGLKEKDQ